MPFTLRANLHSRAGRFSARTRLLAPVMLVALALAVAGCVPRPVEPGGGIGNSEANQLVNLINQDRAGQGLPALAWDDQLGSLAQTWSARMAQNGALSHQDLDALQASPSMSAWRSLGENIYYGGTDVSGANSTWMNSPGHRANILHGFTHVGVGTTRDARGVLWVVADFGTR